MMARLTHERQRYHSAIAQRVQRLLNSGGLVTTSKELHEGLEEIYRDGYGVDGDPLATINGILNRAPFNDRLFWSYDVATGKRERSTNGAACVYLRDDGAPKGHVLVPRSMSARFEQLGSGHRRRWEHIIRAVGADPAVQVTPPAEMGDTGDAPTESETPVHEADAALVDQGRLALYLAEMVREQAAMLQRVTRMLLSLAEDDTDG